MATTLVGLTACFGTAWSNRLLRYCFAWGTVVIGKCVVAPGWLGEQTRAQGRRRQTTGLATRPVGPLASQ